MDTSKSRSSSLQLLVGSDLSFLCQALGKASASSSRITRLTSITRPSSGVDFAFFGASVEWGNYCISQNLVQVDESKGGDTMISLFHVAVCGADQTFRAEEE